MCVVRRAVDGVEHPAVLRDPLALPGFLELLAEHGVIREPIRDHRAESALDLDVDVGDEIDRAFLGDAQIAADVRHLDVPGAQRRFDGGGEIDGGRRRLSHRGPAS